MKYLLSIKFFLSLLFCNSVFAVTSVVPNAPAIERLETVGVMFRTNYQACPDLAVKADLYYINGSGAAEFQNRCFVNSTGSAAFPEVGYCYFRKPMASGTSGSKVLLRLWKTDSKCNQYNDETGNINSGYVDYFLPGNIADSVSYRALKENRLITIDKKNYSLKLDRNGGATYEFYNKRAEKDGGTFLTNAIHSHSGGALQVAIHNHVPIKLMPDSCDSSQGYWNPTQAGYYCAQLPDQSQNRLPNAPAPGNASGLSITCDSIKNDNCKFANDEIIFSKHKMYNWDYSPTFPGPYNAQIDKGYLSQTVTAYENYVTYDITFENKWKDIRGPIEIPTYYFSNVFRKYTYSLNNSITSVTVPDHRTSAPSYRTPDNDKALDWISFENTSGVNNDNYTIAWMYMPDVSADISQPGYGVVETEAFGAIKFTNQPIINFKMNKEYRMRYVVFPYSYDAHINSEFGLKTVREIIAEMKTKYTADPTTQAGTVTNSNGSNTAVTTPTPPSSTQSLNFDGAKSLNNLWPGSNVLDGSLSTSFSSQHSQTATPSDDIQLHVFYQSGPKTLSGVKLYARRVNGKNVGFPKKYNFYVSNSDNSGWDLISTSNTQPDDTGMVNLTFSPRPVNGILIVPIELDKDDEGNYYFQLAEIVAN
ncbi:MAG: discoidin domain-containing protein [Rhizobacter sp.]|nr:discoidin domain-containing protein [Bacteriovorax sp.]